MCGRYTVVIKAEDLVSHYGLTEQKEGYASYNAAPGQLLPVVTSEEPDRISTLKWGLIPHWAPDISRVKPNINARLETARTKNYFKKAFNNHRCLVPATGYYEWKKEGKQKIPYYMHPRSGGFFSFAGIYDDWANPDTGELVRTFAILTQAPTADLEPIHNRMPVPLDKETESLWLNPDSDASELAEMLTEQKLKGKFGHHTVSSAVNRVNNDDPNLIKPYTMPTQTTLW
jgi:putative SOS response-associated peptidase YedK